MNKVEYYQIRVMQLLGELDGDHRTHKDGAALTQRLHEVVENFHNTENDQEEY